MRRATALTIPATAVLLLGACGTDETDDGTGSADTAAESGAEETASPAPEEEPDQQDQGDADQDQGGDGGGQAEASDMLVARDGIWQVGEAGEVEFSTAGGTLELVDVRPADGWTVTDREVESDEIEVDLERGAVDYEFTVELDDGVLEIEIDQDVDPAEPGRYDVGEGGVVELAVDGGSLRLVETTPSEGWTVVEESIEGDEIEVDFRRGAAQWELDAELESDGSLEVEIDFEVSGPVNG